jgi:hypothetical protein
VKRYENACKRVGVRKLPILQWCRDSERIIAMILQKHTEMPRQSGNYLFVGMAADQDLASPEMMWRYYDYAGPVTIAMFESVVEQRPLMSFDTGGWRYGTDDECKSTGIWWGPFEWKDLIEHIVGG